MGYPSRGREAGGFIGCGADIALPSGVDQAKILWIWSNDWRSSKRTYHRRALTRTRAMSWSNLARFGLLANATVARASATTTACGTPPRAPRDVPTAVPPPSALRNLRRAMSVASDTTNCFSGEWSNGLDRYPRVCCGFMCAPPRCLTNGSQWGKHHRVCLRVEQVLVRLSVVAQQYALPRMPCFSHRQRSLVRPDRRGMLQSTPGFASVAMNLLP